MTTNGSKTEPTLNDVMTMLQAINSKLDHPLPFAPPYRQRSPEKSPPCSPALPHKVSTNPVDVPDEPLTGGWAPQNVIERVLYPRDKIQDRVKELAKEISADYPDASEESFAVIGLMSGCYMFMADISRELEVPHRIDFMAVSSYGMETVSSANIKVKKDLDLPVAGKDVLIVDEMCDTGRTMACLVQWMYDKGAKSVKVAVLLNKAERREVEGLTLDYCGWDCEDEFLVGYGMDWSHRFRSLPDISVVRRSAYAKD